MSHEYPGGKNSCVVQQNELLKSIVAELQRQVLQLQARLSCALKEKTQAKVDRNEYKAKYRKLADRMNISKRPGPKPESQQTIGILMNNKKPGRPKKETR